MEGLLVSEPTGWVGILHNWQDFYGAIIGGLMGVTGAMIVAGNQKARETRSAAYMLKRDCLNVMAMVYKITYGGHTTLEVVGGETVTGKLLFYRHELSPLFDQYMTTISATDQRQGALLEGFRQAYVIAGSHLEKVRQGRGNAQELDELRALVVTTMQRAYDCAAASTYRLDLHTIGLVKRALLRLHRRFMPTHHDKILQELTARLMSPPPSPAPNEPATGGN